MNTTKLQINYRKSLFLLICVLLFIPSFSQSQNEALKNSKIIANGATLKQVAADYIFTEGPAVDSEGNVFFTDQPNNRIMKWSTDGSISTYMEKAGRANGLYFDHQENLLACADENNQLWRINKDKEVEILVNDFQGKKLNGPNDLWVDPQGGIYFTDPFYKRKYWTRTEKEIEQENVYYLSPNKRDLRIVANDFNRPNGIVGTANGKKLYVTDANGKATYVFKIKADGELSNKKLFCDMRSDGMTLDNKGNVYLTGKGVTVFNKRGKKVAHIDIDEGWTSNVCFGGKDQQTLFITAMKSLYTIEMKVKGVR